MPGPLLFIYKCTKAPNQKFYGGLEYWRRRANWARDIEPRGQWTLEFRSADSPKAVFALWCPNWNVVVFFSITTLAHHSQFDT